MTLLNFTIQFIFIYACVVNVMQRNVVGAIFFYCLAFAYFSLIHFKKRKRKFHINKTEKTRYFNCVIPTTIQGKHGKRKVIMITFGVDKKERCENGSIIYSFRYKNRDTDNLDKCDFSSFYLRYEDVIAEFIKANFKEADLSGQYVIKEIGM